MIQSFSCKDTLALFEGRCPRRFSAIQVAAERKLEQLDVALTLAFLRSRLPLRKRDHGQTNQPHARRSPR